MSLKQFASIVGAVPVFVCVLLAGQSPALARALSFDERVAAQKAIEQVYWDHRVWPKENPGPKPQLAAVISDAAIRAKVEGYLKKSNALETWWQRPVTAEQLQAELDRMARKTRDAGVLQELYRALGNDPYVIAETLGRQTLADRLIRSWYATDSRFHGELKAKAEHALATCANADCMKTMGGRYEETTWKLRTADVDPAADTTRAHAMLLDADEWKDQLDHLAAQLGATGEALPTGRLSGLEETSDAFIVTTVRSQKEGELVTASVVWPKRTFDAWWSKEQAGTTVDVRGDTATYTVAAPSSDPCVNDTWVDTVDEPEPRYAHTAVWTGSEMIVWGGVNGLTPYLLNSGGRYNPATDTWTETSQGANVPSARENHTAIWTGTEMIVWGGGFGSVGTNSGGRYNPSTNTWVPTSQGANVPTARTGHTSVWTGSTMIVWGGESNNQSFNSGGRYDPSSDTWLPTSTGTNVPTPRGAPAVVWSGTEMIIWGGFNNVYIDTGARYNPSTDTWATMTPAEPTLSFWPQGPAIWTGVEMIVWGFQNGSLGARYNPATDSWTPMSFGGNAPVYRSGHTLVWTGTEMIVWGGSASGNASLNTGGRYKPSTDTWLPTSTGANVPVGRTVHTAVWTGTEMIVWGGVQDQYGSVTLSSGGRYNPTTDSWIPTHVTPGVPTARSQSSAVWTGTEMIVWSGRPANDISSSPVNTGGRYNPSTDSWTPTSTTNTPSPGGPNTAVWTGTEMIFWGGGNADGGRYNPATDTWFLTSTGLNTPSARSGHTVVWTGTEMIVWGGGSYNTGARYNPVTNSWITTSTGANVPSARGGYTAVWTGTEMIVWGGSGGGNTGGRYNPSTDSWTTTSTGLNVPTGRYFHTAVWTGTEMIVWGGGTSIVTNTGGRYVPSTDSWTATSTGANVPSARASHTATWTGAEMIVWGGTTTAINSNSGGRYNPSTDTWTATSTGANVPSARYTHTAVWTGTQMIVWGGGAIAVNPGVYCACPSGRIVYRDADGDGYGLAAVSMPACDGSVPVGYSANSLDCNDANAAVHPGATETCNGLDDNCDGIVDNGASALCNDSDVCTDDACNAASGCSHTFNSAPCDDGVLCTNNDICNAGTCAGVLGPTPEVHGVAAAGHSTTTLSWTGLGGATTYDLTTSTLADLRVQATVGATCLAAEVTGTAYPDTQPNPAAGNGYFYLIRAENVCGTGSYGFDSNGGERVPTVGCP